MRVTIDQPRWHFGVSITKHCLKRIIVLKLSLLQVEEHSWKMYDWWKLFFFLTWSLCFGCFDPRLSQVQTVMIVEDSFNNYARLYTNHHALSSTIIDYHQVSRSLDTVKFHMIIDDFFLPFERADDSVWWFLSHCVIFFNYHKPFERKQYSHW